MKSTGITRAIDHLGRFVIPKELRRAFNINDKDMLEIFTDGQAIILKKCVPSCVLCRTQDHLNRIDDKHICDDCLAKIKRL